MPTKNVMGGYMVILLRGNIASFVSITNAKIQDVNILDDFIAEPDTIDVKY